LIDKEFWKVVSRNTDKFMSNVNVQRHRDTCMQ